MREIVDRDHDEGAGTLVLFDVFQCLGHFIDQGDAVEVAGQFVVTAEVLKTLLFLIALIDYADDTMCVGGLSKWTRKAPAIILNPQNRRVSAAVGTQFVLNRVGNTAPFIRAGCRANCLISLVCELRVDQLMKSCTAGKVVG